MDQYFKDCLGLRQFSRTTENLAELDKFVVNMAEVRRQAERMALLTAALQELLTEIELNTCNLRSLKEFVNRTEREIKEPDALIPSGLPN